MIQTITESIIFTTKLKHQFKVEKLTNDQIQKTNNFILDNREKEYF